MKTNPHKDTTTQIPQVLNIYKSPGAKTRPDCVYIGRPSKWGNPFAIGKDGTREEVVEKYRIYLLSHPELMEQVRKELVVDVLPFLKEADSKSFFGFWWFEFSACRRFCGSSMPYLVQGHVIWPTL